MSGPQFAHLQTWSRKDNPRGRSIQSIIDEALREAGACPHVDDPQPPRVLLGDPARFKADHDEHVAARATIVRMKDGSERSRAIRQDRHTMASIVVSYPVPRSAITTDEARAKYDAWERRNLEWLRETYGDQLRVVMAHDDEEHGHLHAWLLPDDPGADATTLHPGKVAKKAAEAEAKASGLAPREAVDLGNRALKAAMTDWQDAYYRAVGAPEGLTRAGPRRRRLTREQWKAEKAAARATAEVAQKAEAEAEAFRAGSARRAGIQMRWDARRAKRLEARAEQTREAQAAVARRTEIQARWDARRDARIMTRFEAAEEAAASAINMSMHAQEKSLALREHAEQVRVQSIKDAVSEIEARRRAANTDIEKERAKLDQRSTGLDRRRSELDQRADELDQRSSELDQRADELDLRADGVAATERRLDLVSVRLNSALKTVHAAFKFIAEKLGVPISSGFNAALSEVEAALEEAEATLAPAAPAMRIAAASASPEEPGDESPGMGF